MSATLLAEETAFFDKNDRAFQRKYKGRVLLIHRGNLIGDFDDEESAVIEGVRQFGRGPFLVRKPGEPVPTFSIPAHSLGLMYASTSTYS